MYSTSHLRVRTSNELSDELPGTNRVYPKQVVDLFEGEQLVLVGRYKKSGVAKIVIDGRTGSMNQHFDFPSDFTAKSGDASYAFVEKLWATRRIGEIIDEIDLHGKNDELVQELVKLSTQHGIITPYTSFLADDQVNMGDWQIQGAVTCVQMRLPASGGARKEMNGGGGHRSEGILHCPAARFHCLRGVWLAGI